MLDCEKRYLQDEFAKLLTVLNAAEQNTTCHTKVHVNTAGNNPNASVSIEASVLRKFIKAP